MEVDVDKLISDRKESIKVKSNVEKRDKKIKIKVKKTPINQPVFREIPQEFKEELARIKNEGNMELNQSIKGNLIKALSYPAKHKKDVLEEKINKSEFMNRYIDNKMSWSILNKLNDDMRFGLLYIYYYGETMK